MADPYLPDNREFDPKDPNPCAGCSHCCEYISLEIDKPNTVKDFDYIAWYLMHKDVWVYINGDNEWFLQFNTPCEKLVDQRCDYYPHRPQVCRDYSPVDCFRHADEVDEKFLFKNEIDLHKYMEKKRPAVFKKLKAKINIPALKKSPSVIV